ncbi:MAG: helicase C-terminal domain-containing protein [Candidatus Bathyarchaeia archaeon]
MHSKVQYVCRRCGEVFSIEDYERSNFCRKCGTLLRRAFEKKDYEAVEGGTRGESDFQILLAKFFPYPSFRPFQRDAIKFAFNVFLNGQIGLFSSPCGTGKSISVLTAFFMARELNSSLGRLLALTRTRNQLEIYCRELREIKENCDVSVTASIFKSKKEMCPRILEDPKLEGLSYRDFLHYCKGLKEGSFGEACKYYERAYDGWKPSWHTYALVNKIRGMGPLLPEDVFEICRDAGLCPYEITRVLTRYADVVVGNYNYVLVDSIRGSVLGRAGVKMGEINCVFDEAHSLPYYAAGIFSDELSSISVKRALKEIELFGIDGFGFLGSLRETLFKFGKYVYRKCGLDVEHIVEKEAFIKSLLKSLGVEAENLLDIISELSTFGDVIRQKRVEEGKSPVSYLSRCVEFFSEWIGVSGSSYVRYVKVEVGRAGKKIIKLGVRCLDPALASSVINDLRSAILMSGTLWHTDYYIDVLGLERKRCESMELPSPFPAENRLILVDKAVTTKFEKRNEQQWKKIAEHLVQIIRHVDGNVAVYFPSYEIMHKIVEAAKFDLPTIVEERGTKILDVLRFLKENKRCVIFGVARGKISEGVDMTNEGKSLLSAVAIVGLPYPKRTELQDALYQYFREKFGDKAIEYANDIPCLNALAQSAGRLLRSPNDRGIIIIMDGRAAGKFRWKLPKDWREEMQSHLSIEKIVDKIKSFFNNYGHGFN